MADIDVCVCTFRRPMIAETLKSIAAQTVLHQHTIRVIIADNDETRAAEPTIVAACQELGLLYTYVHAPSRNISIARNACLDAARAEFVTFIDDDEIAEPDWLAAMLAFFEQNKADVVFGPVDPVYPPGTAPWLQQWAFHGSATHVRTDERVETGYSGNVMMRRETIGADRFDPAFGRSGGEDTMFFHALFQRGVALAYCPDALVHEPVAAERTRLSWILRRAYRNGDTYGAMMARHARVPFHQAVLASAKVGYCFVNAAVCLPVRGLWQRHLVRGAMHAGFLARVLRGDKAAAS